MVKVINKVLAILGFINKVNPMVVDSVSTATAKMDKIVGTTMDNLRKVEVAKCEAKKRIDEAKAMLEEEYKKAELEAEEATEKLANLESIFGKK